MARRIQQVDCCGVVIELQNRGGDRDAPLLFKLHPVGCDLALFPPRFHGAGLLNRTPIKKELFGECCLACVRVGNNREIATAIDCRCDHLTQIPLLRCRAARHLVISIHQA